MLGIAKETLGESRLLVSPLHMHMCKSVQSKTKADRAMAQKAQIAIFAKTDKQIKVQTAFNRNSISIVRNVTRYQLSSA